MGIINIVQNIKLVHKEELLLVKIGNFYHVYGKDAYIISYLFKYKLQEVESTATCGFPLSSANRVLSRLEDKKINYIIVDRRNNYEVDSISNNKNLNTYSKIYENAKIHIGKQVRINNINKFLEDNMDSPEFKNIILQMEKIVINERRKISSN